MCGIAGLMTTTGLTPDRDLLLRMQTALKHRGPDGAGDYASGDTGMVQTRLAIIDLDTGDQPIHEPAGGALVANGEVYNYVELRTAMTDAVFSTSSDCEPPLHLYRKHGADYARELRGMYAIAIHDPAAGRLLLSRDPFGIKPLYYAMTDRGFAFASEPQALIAAGLVEPQLRTGAGAELLQLQFTTGRETAFVGIERVLPGETLIVSGGRIIDRRRIPALPDAGPEGRDEASMLTEIDTALTDSVSVHQRSDVPYGMFLSGGIDSSVVLALMARLNDQPVRAFTVGFSGTAVADERELAKRVATSLGAEHVEVEFGRDDFWSLLPEIVGFIDDPAADYAILPTYKLGQVAGQDLKVILCGEGGDELFGGYGRYRSYMRPWWMWGRTLRPRGFLQGFGVLRDETPAWRDGVAAAERMETRNGRSALQVAQAIDCADWLPHDLLIKLDRCLMAHGVEGRTPMLDPVVANAAFRLPDRFKVHGRTGKWLLRKWLEKAVPAAEPFAPKRGFTVPVGEWIAERGAEIGPLVAAQPGVADLCRPDAVEKVFQSRERRAGRAAWSLLFFALWHQRHILGLTGDGDVASALTER